MGTSFWDLVEKEKKKKFGLNSGLNINTPTQAPTGAFGELVKEQKFKSSPYTAFDDDIAPVKTTSTSSPINDKKLTNFFTVTEKEDFKEKSGYIGTKAEGFWDKLNSKYGLGYTDLQYEYINNQNGIRDEISQRARSWGSDTGKTTSSYEENALDYMKAEEIAVYNYYYHTEGKEKAQEFLDTLAETLNKRKAGKDFSAIQGKTAAEILHGIDAGTHQFEQGVKNLGNMIVGKDDYIPLTSTQILTGMVREDLADDGFNVLGNSLGQVAFDALSTGANMAPSIAVSAAVSAFNPVAGQIVGNALMGSSAAGNAYQQVLNEGHDKDKARTYATSIGVLEGTLQYVLGGIGKLGGTSSYISNAVSGIKNGLLRFSLEYGSKIGSEALEEGLQEILDPLVKNAVTGTNEEVDWENVVYSGLLGGLMAGVYGASEVSNSHLSNDEQTVFDKATEALIASREQKFGRELTSKEKREARQEIRENLEHGGLEIDSIAEFLGGESYEAFKAESDSFFGSEAYKAMREAERNEKLLPELQKEYDKLHAIMPEKKTGAQQNKEASLLEQINAIKNAPKSSDLKAQIDPNAIKRLVESRNKMHQDTFARVKNSRLAESYLEDERSRQKLDIDVSKYTDENARKTVQAIIDSGLGDNSNSFKHFVDLVAQVSAKHKNLYFDLTENKRLGIDHTRDGLTTNGYKLTDENGTTIVINKDAANPLRVVVGHEFAHVLEKSGFYDAIADTALKFAELKEGKAGLKARLDEATRIYKDDKNTTPEKEVVADLIGEYVFTDYEFIRNLAKTNRKGFMKLFDEIKYLTRIATAGSKVYRELAKLKNNFERAYREYGSSESNVDGGVQHSFYSRPDFNKEEWAIVNRRKHSEFDNPKYDLDNGNKWMYANEKGYTVFAVYSKYDPEDPTVLYGSSGKAAARDYATVVAHQQGGTNANRGRTTLDRLLAYLESNEVQRNNGLTDPKGTLSATEDVSLPFGQSRSNGRGDYLDGGENLQGTELTKYDDEASGEPGASITFSNDYQYFRNRLKEGDTGESDVQYSLSAVEAVEPKSDLWHRTFTTDEAKAIFPDMWNVAAEESEVRNPTQITSTVKSYRKVYDFLKAEGFDGTILDASSGLGYGTKAGIDEYGFNVEDIEPYPDSSYDPKYRDYSTLDKKYDAIISNAVLNVLPQDQRDALVVKMGELLNDGGRIFINVRGKDVESLAKTGKNIHLGNMEWIETVKGSYQKGFTKDELVAYLKDALGDGFTVEKTNMFGAVSAIVTKDSGVKYSLTAEQNDQDSAQKVIENLKVRAQGSKYLAGYATYTEERMDRELRASSASHIPDYAKSYITWVDPIDFIYATTTSQEFRDHLKKEAGALDIERLKSETQPIHLTVNFETGEVVGHEGRHRMLALQAEGIEKVAVVIDALNHDKHHTKPIEFMQLKGQRFSEYSHGVDIFLHNMLPLSQRYADDARKLFTNKPKSGIQYSLTKDTHGNELTKEQQDFFKNAKTVDENGNLKTLYHGSRSEAFSVFDLYEGVWLTTDPRYAEIYAGQWHSWRDDIAPVGEQRTDLNGLEPEVYSDPDYRVYEMYANITNPADIGELDIPLSDSKVRQLAQALGMRYSELKPLADTFMEEETYMLTRSREFIELAKEKGFDGFKATEKGKETWCAFASEDQVKLTTNAKPTGNLDVRYSMSKATETDKSYFDALEKGDGVTAQRLLEEAARKASYKKAVFHGTSADFTVFDTDEDSTAREVHPWDAEYPDGTIFVAEDRGVASYYGSKVMPLYLNTEGMKTFVHKDMPAHRAMDDLHGYAVYEYPVIAVKGSDMTIYATLDNTRLKSAELITLDDEGAVIPLSQRFNKTSPDIRFSLSKTVEETKDLVALHNLTADKLLKSLELGGLPMPSIAITKADIPHDNFGDITLILGKDSIDPKANKKNVVYSADAWTPTFPQVEYEADANVERQINKKLLDLATKVDDVFKHDIDMLRYSHEDNLNRYGGEEGYIKYVMDKYGFKAAYLEDQGKHVDKITKQEEVPKAYNSANEAKYQAIADILGVSNADEIGKLNLKETIEQYGDQLEDIYPGMTKSAMRMSGIFRQVMAYMEDTSGAPVYRTVTDESAMRKAVDDAIDMEGFEAWTRKLFSGIVKDTGIYNNKDFFTPSGNRRSFKQTHLPFTLENIVKAMASQNQGNTKNVSGFNGIKSLRAGTAERFKSIEAMHERKGRLQHLTQEEADKINDDLSARLFAIIETIDNESGNHGETNSFIRFDTIGEILMEVSEGGKYNVVDIQKVFAQYSRNISDDLAADIKQLLFDVSQMPVNIYEAKPERAVSFDEVGVFVIPRNADIKLKQELLNRGYSIAEYDPDVEGDRQKVVNQFEEYKFSLSDAGKEQSAESKFLKYTRGAGRRNSFAEKLADLAPVRDDIAPVREDAVAEESTVAEAPATTETVLFPDEPISIEQLNDELDEVRNLLQMAVDVGDYEAISQYTAEHENLRRQLAEYEADDADRFGSIEDTDAPPEIDIAPVERASVVPLTKKAAQDIARDVRQKLGLSNKHMYDVHMLVEEYSQTEFPDREQLFNKLKEKFGTYTESEFDETVKDAKSYLRNNGLFVSDSIQKEIADYAHLMRKNRGRIRFSNEGTEVDVLYHELNTLYPHLFPDDILSPTDQFLQMVDVANMDAESKVEMELPDEEIWEVADAVRNSVTEYQQSQKEKAANKYSRESFNSLMRNADQYAPPVEEDIAPVAPVSQAAPVDDIAPTRENVKVAEKVAPSAVSEPTTANERLAKKLANYQTELERNQQERAKSIIDYDNEIARLQAEYDAKKNKRSMAAHDLLRRIERVKRMKNNVDADYAKRINDITNRIEKLNTKEAKTAAQRQTKMEQHTEFWKNVIGDTSTWVDLPLGLMYKTKTLRRILRKVVRGADGKPNIALADQIYTALETKYDYHEAQLKRESRKLKEVFQKLNLNHYEDTYAHMAGEFRHNPDTTLTVEVVQEYYNKHKKKIDINKVNTAIDEARKTFDSLLERVNKALKEQGFKEIPYRQGYFPHFKNPKQGWLAKLLNWKTIDNEIPTSIAGLTETFTPQRSWQSFNKKRMGDATDYSLYQGLDTYVHGALDWIYHIDDLQSRRALENHLRYIHSDEGVKARIEEIKANEEYDADEAQVLIDGVLKEAENPLGGLVRELMNRTNTLANKKAAGDRDIEDKTSRKVYSVMTNLNNRINANMVVGSFSSAFTNIIPMVQSWHQVSPWFTVRGLGDFVRSVVRDDGMVEKSDYLTNRLIEEEKLYQTGWDKVTDKAAWLMNVIDNITAQTVWRSKYLQNLSEGMSEERAIFDADQFAKNLMAGRSRGNAPTIFDEKNPVTKIFTAFQLEVANQYGYMFEDVPQDSTSKARLVKGYATAFLGAYLYNALYSSLVGRDAAFDPIGIIEDLFRNLFGDDDEEEDEENVKDALFGLGEDVLQQVPFVGGLIGGGRIPLSAALPYSNDSTPFQSMVSDIEKGVNEDDWTAIGKEVLKPLYYLAMPVGGGQLKKTFEGLSMFSSKHPVTGSYTDSGKLRFPVEKTPGNVIQAAMFGQYASENARYYFDNDIAPLGEKQIQEYKDVDIPIKDYWNYRKGLKGKDTLGEKLAYIDKLDLPIRKQNILANNLSDRKEPINMADWDKYDGLEEYDYAKKYPEKYQFLEANGISVEEYNNFDDDTKEAYSWAYQNPDKYTLSKAVARDLMTYRKYANDLNDIKADKDEDGKSISGSRKDKVVEYINNMDADYGEKIILFKSEYPSDDTYNNEIVEYLNSREDISYDEEVTILRELGFTVLDDGTVLWD